MAVCNYPPHGNAVHDTNHTTGIRAMTLAGRTVVVLGMHRSGTSALTGALVQAGLCVGAESTLYKTDKNNEKGYFEQQALIDINESILTSAFLHKHPDLLKYGCHRDEHDLYCMGWLLGAWLEKPDLTELPANIPAAITEFIRKLGDACPGTGGFIMKDPRLSLTFPVWEPYLQKPVVLVMTRHPTAVARSIQRRDNSLYEGLGVRVWERYTRAALLNSVNCPTRVINYDQFVENPGTEIKTLIEWLNHNGFNIAYENQTLAMNFVTPRLRHNQVQTQEQLPSDILELYDRIIESGTQVPLDYLASSSWNVDSYPWQSALYVLARNSGKSRIAETENELNSRLTHAESVHARLVNHPVAGPVIRLLQKLKRDTTFGALQYHCIPRRTRR